MRKVGVGGGLGVETVSWIGRLLAGFTFLLVALVLAAGAAYAQGAAQGGGGYSVPVSGSGVPAGRLLRDDNLSGNNVSVQPVPSCHDDFKNQDEYGADCGGVCVTNAPELCDGMDNNRNCLIDEGRVCAPKPQPIPVPQRQPDSDYPISISPEQAPDQLVRGGGGGGAVEAADGVSGVPVLEGSGESSATEGQKPQAGAAIDDAEEVTLLRQYIKDNNVYVPAEEGDVELLRKYRLFAEKHGAEFEAEYTGKELTEKEFAEILRQFSEESYPKKEEKPQSRSFFSKVKGFFKRLFG